MKTIEMLKTETCELANGSRRVFGPAGKSFTVDDDTAAALIKAGAAIGEDVRVDEEETEPAVVSGEEDSE